MLRDLSMLASNILVWRMANLPAPVLFQSSEIGCNRVAPKTGIRSLKWKLSKKRSLSVSGQHCREPLACALTGACDGTTATVDPASVFGVFGAAAGSTALSQCFSETPELNRCVIQFR